MSEQNQKINIEASNSSSAIADPLLKLVSMEKRGNSDVTMKGSASSKIGTDVQNMPGRPKGILKAAEVDTKPFSVLPVGSGPMLDSEADVPSPVSGPQAESEPRGIITTKGAASSNREVPPPSRHSELRLKLDLTDSIVKIVQPSTSSLERSCIIGKHTDDDLATDPIKRIHCLQDSLLNTNKGVANPSVDSNSAISNPLLTMGLSESVLKASLEDSNASTDIPKLSASLETISSTLTKDDSQVLNLTEQVSPKIMDSIELQDTSSALSAVMSASTDESGKTEESVEFARPAQVASRDALDIEDTTTMLTGPESKENTQLVSTSPFPLGMEEDSVGSMIVNKLAKQADSGLEVPMEDDSRSSFDSFKTPLSRELTSSEVPPEDDSQSSFASQRSAKQRWDAVDERSSVFPAENLFEYQWPPTKLGEYYMLQEQISEYLGVKSFKRKHRDLLRRAADKDEKQFLRERGVVTETQCDLGLTALRSDEILELMMRDYPEKYAEYDRVLQEKEKQSISEKHKLYLSSQPHVEKSKMAEFVSKAITATAEWNMHFNRERKEERRACFDLQTFTLQYPTGKKAKLDKEATAVGHYPVALVPGQYQDHYRRYTCAELKYYPLNTVLYGPRTTLSQDMSQQVSDGSQSDSEESSSSDGGSSSGSSQGTHDGSGDSSSAESASKVPIAEDGKSVEEKPKLKSIKMGAETKVLRVKLEDKLPHIKVKNGACRVCKGKERNKRGNPEEMVGCSECKKKGHPTCLDLTNEMVAVIKSYPWQCMDCKTCMHCMDPYDEDKMMFCDKCDRGYHTFCIGLKNLPSGRWICAMCGECGSCGAKKPSPDDSKQQWHHEDASPAVKLYEVVKLFRNGRLTHFGSVI